MTGAWKGQLELGKKKNGALFSGDNPENALRIVLILRMRKFCYVQVSRGLKLHPLSLTTYLVSLF